ncbi:hypothetical protein SAMN05661008_00346 [Alkalithermobacter thermoalcaliphilus JW-YL-7 = DSM 7308]|uniref:Uncharacterized protein n=1 Tax=Alkalithermobacter thermoalcaliphilus JW-YL-7 = DSM 7308 TaxID=1121328 RepID=A0A150FPH7_CLOPD|nr:hypothetical protein JWYL7_0543 [[Clostridium] paradoxum JW-YL-7 = DSM 7308]SHK50528.1 hypothetical protein SAMN05661008_00346 [[Clostridium] paradoxum JW-YL-7 = DSM 7308]
MRKIKMKNLDEKVLTKEDLLNKLNEANLYEIAEEMYNTYVYASIGAVAEIDVRTGKIIVDKDEYITDVDMYYIPICHLNCTTELPDLEIEDNYRELTEEEKKEQEEMRIEAIVAMFHTDNIDEFYKEY